MFRKHIIIILMVFFVVGAATVRIAMPASLQSSLIFHYNLKCYENEGDTFDGVSLKRFVMQVRVRERSILIRIRNPTLILSTCSQSVVGNIVSFRVHAPSSGAFLLDIFANSVTPKEYLTGEPMKFKSVCKLKIACEDLQTVMVPLPDCASGEWGPTKATRLFGLIPITHQVLASKCLKFLISDFSYRLTKIFAFTGCVDIYWSGIRNTVPNVATTD